MPSPDTQSSARRASTPQRRSTLIQRTMRQLLRDIMDGVYGPGDRIPETELAERLGVSRAPVREALRTLENDGLVELTPWRGARVIDPTPEDIAALFDLLASVYGTVARLAARQASDADLARFARDVDQFETAERNDDELMELIEIAYRAGVHLGQASGSHLAADTLRRLGRAAYWMHRYLTAAPQRWRDASVTKYRKLEAALMARSEQRSETAARQLVQHTARLIEKHAPAARR